MPLYERGMESCVKVWMNVSMYEWTCTHTYVYADIHSNFTYVYTNITTIIWVVGYSGLIPSLGQIPVLLPPAYDRNRVASGLTLEVHTLVCQGHLTDWTLHEARALLGRDSYFIWVIYHLYYNRHNDDHHYNLWHFKEDHDFTVIIIIEMITMRRCTYSLYVNHWN